MHIIPAVDVLDGTVVRLLHGDYDAVTAYGDDPVDVAARWVDEGAQMVHVVDLEGARTGEPTRSLWRSLSDSGIPFQVGGGIRDVSSATEAVDGGAARVVVGSAAVHDDVTLTAIVDAVGTTRVVAAIDVRGGKARGSGWLDDGVDLRTVTRRVVGAGVGIALVTGIERDGAMEGPNLELLATVARIAPGLSVIASGGIGSLDDLVMLRDSGYMAAIVGRALYESRFTLEEAMNVAADR